MVWIFVVSCGFKDKMARQAVRGGGAQVSTCVSRREVGAGAQMCACVCVQVGAGEEMCAYVYTCVFPGGAQVSTFCVQAPGGRR